MVEDEEKNIMDEEAVVSHRRRSSLRPFRDEGRFRVLRFWLNIAFILGAFAGMALYFTEYRQTAIYILIAASVPKFAELTLRILKL